MLFLSYTEHKNWEAQFHTVPRRDCLKKTFQKKMKMIAIPWFEFVNRMKVEEEIWGKRIRFMDFLTKVINNAGIKEFLCGVGSRLLMNLLTNSSISCKQQINDGGISNAIRAEIERFFFSFFCWWMRFDTERNSKSSLMLYSFSSLPSYIT